MIYKKPYRYDEGFLLLNLEGLQRGETFYAIMSG